MKTLRNMGLGLCLAWAAAGGVWAQAAAAVEDLEVWGVVKLWAPGAQRIEVEGQTYRLARDVQVVDRDTRLLPSHRVRPGVKVLLLVSDGQVVTHVVVNPGENSPFDKVSQ
ncbi:MAG TPA: hypothetical protein PKC60_07225 [Hydrogenophaga sp.]|uniref:hypothetical protein n=1 Tax=Hydrogenophaga sp. TaxID=1904254 RepID=UPI002BB28A17|nr:hypothetical protein [Hydrogenophaga sp.]HMN93005.1 hypothetical protein [Hydrogenophaga sp.]HMP10776.1 hypothetical protein [Hydrogenophaga sp.]